MYVVFLFVHYDLFKNCVVIVRPMTIPHYERVITFFANIRHLCSHNYCVYACIRNGGGMVKE